MSKTISLYFSVVLPFVLLEIGLAGEEVLLQPRSERFLSLHLDGSPALISGSDPRRSVSLADRERSVFITPSERRLPASAPELETSAFKRGNSAKAYIFYTAAGGDRIRNLRKIYSLPT